MKQIFHIAKIVKKIFCVACETEHQGHEIITYGSLLPNLKKIKEEVNNFYD